MLRFVVLASITLFSLCAYPSEYLGYKLKDNSLFIQMDKQTIQLRGLSDTAVETHYLTDQNFPSFALDPTLSLPSDKASVTETDYSLTFHSQQVSVVFHKLAHTLSYFQQGKLLTRHLVQQQQAPAVQFSFDLSESEKLMGTGERVLGMDRRGHKLPLYNRAHYGYTTHSEQMNYSLPAVMSNKKYVLLFDNSAKGWLDLGKTNNSKLEFSAVGGRAAFIIAAAENYPSLIHKYVELTGKQPMPARWFLGNHASRFGYKSQQQVMDTINLYRQLDIPVDSIILDLYWFGKDVQGHMGHLSWDKEAFPEPEKMIQELAQMGVKTTLITEPFMLKQAKRHDEALAAQALSLNSSGTEVKYYDFYFGHTALIDVFSDKGQTWFAKVYRELAQQGVTGVWGDLGEPEVHPEDMQHTLSEFGVTASADEVHNVYGHQWADLVQGTLSQVQPNSRPFILMRAGFAGSQRFGLIPWTGDVSRSWGGLKPQVELSLQMGLLGLAYTHSDLGGFAGDNYDKELYIRWLQFGVFQPIYRPHAQDKVPSEPVYHDAETQDILREYIKLRYALLPYNYTLAYQNALTGMPLMRPMFFADEADPALIDIKDQFMWGDDFIVKPITDPGVTSSKVALPAGNWFNYWTGDKYLGNSEVEVEVDLTTIPVLVRGGAIIPTVEPVSSTDTYSSEKLNLDFYFDPEVTSGSTTVYEDDGKSANSLSAEKYELLTFDYTTSQGSDKLVLKLNRQTFNGYQGMPKDRQITLKVHNVPESFTGATVDEQTLQILSAKDALASVNQGIHYDKQSKQLTITVQWKGNQQTLAFSF